MLSKYSYTKGDGDQEAHTGKKMAIKKLGVKVSIDESKGPKVRYESTIVQ